MLKVSGCDVPDWILKLKKVDKKTQKHLERFPVKREHIDQNPNLHKEFDPEYSKSISIAQKKFKKQQK